MQRARHHWRALCEIVRSTLANANAPVMKLCRCARSVNHSSGRCSHFGFQAPARVIRNEPRMRHSSKLAPRSKLSRWHYARPTSHYTSEIRDLRHSWTNLLKSRRISPYVRRMLIESSLAGSHSVIEVSSEFRCISYRYQVRSYFQSNSTTGSNCRRRGSK
jgi:hypothetical protein